jgi:hypothetical protein
MTPEIFVEQLAIDLDLPEKMDKILVDQLRKQAGYSVLLSQLAVETTPARQSTLSTTLANIQVGHL